MADDFRTDVVVRDGGGFFVSDTRIRLLEAVARHGSITRAAKAVPMSYKAAWDAIDEMNNLAPQSLVERSVGGRHGGGALLSGYGVRMIALYRALAQRFDATTHALAHSLEAISANGAQELDELLARLALRSSARNAFAGTVEAVSSSAEDVDAEVTVRVDASLALCATVPTDVVERLELAPGVPVAALVASSAVYLSTGDAMRVAARNRFDGRVLEVHRGPVNAEVTLELAGGRTLTATVTAAAADELGLAAGVRAQALFKASSLMLQRRE